MLDLRAQSDRQVPQEDPVQEVTLVHQVHQVPLAPQDREEILDSLDQSERLDQSDRSVPPVMPVHLANPVHLDPTDSQVLSDF